jgi:hypothetical protein
VATDPLQAAARRIAVYLSARYPQVRIIEDGGSVAVSDELGFLYVDLGGATLTAETPAAKRMQFILTPGDQVSEFGAVQDGVEFLQVQLSERAGQFPSPPEPPHGVTVMLVEGPVDDPIGDADVVLSTDEAAVFSALVRPDVEWEAGPWALTPYETGLVPQATSFWTTSDLFDFRLRLNLNAYTYGSAETVERLASLGALTARIVGTGPVRDQQTVVNLPAPQDPAGVLPEVARALRDDEQQRQADLGTSGPEPYSPENRMQRAWRALRRRPRP